MFLSKFPQTNNVVPSSRTVICDTCEQINVSGDIVNTWGNVKY